MTLRTSQTMPCIPLSKNGIHSGYCKHSWEVSDYANVKNNWLLLETFASKSPSPSYLANVAQPPNSLHSRSGLQSLYSFLRRPLAPWKRASSAFLSMMRMILLVKGNNIPILKSLYPMFYKAISWFEQNVVSSHPKSSHTSVDSENDPQNEKKACLKPNVPMSSRH